MAGQAVATGELASLPREVVWGLAVGCKTVTSGAPHIQSNVIWRGRMEGQRRREEASSRRVAGLPNRPGAQFSAAPGLNLAPSGFGTGRARLCTGTTGQSTFLFTEIAPVIEVSSISRAPIKRLRRHKWTAATARDSEPPAWGLLDVPGLLELGACSFQEAPSGISKEAAGSVREGPLFLPVLPAFCRTSGMQGKWSCAAIEIFNP